MRQGWAHMPRLPLRRPIMAERYGAGHAHLPGGHGASEVVDAHLGAGMQGQIRIGVPDCPGQAEILHKHRIRALFRGKACRRKRGRHLAVADQRVQGDVDLAGAQMTVAHSLFKLFRCEIVRRAARVEIAEAEIDGVRTVLNRCYDSLRRARRGKQFHHFRTSESHLAKRLLQQKHCIIPQLCPLRQGSFHAII